MTTRSKSDRDQRPLAPSLIKRGKKGELSDLLFEIGCEELPATSLADIFESSAPFDNAFAEKLKKLLTEKRLVFNACQVYATPRRLVFLAEGLAASQSARDQMTKLLSKQEAYGADGNPTEKFLTILKHRGAGIGETVVSDLNGKPFVYIRKPEPCEKTVKILPEVFDALVKSLNFPKNMKWDDSGLYFSRPIRHTLGIFGKTILRFKIGSVLSAPGTVIFLKGKRSCAAVKNIPSYFKVLQKYGVILSQSERKKAIQDQLEKSASALKRRLYADPFLLNEVNYLVEVPHVLSAPFGDEFLSLPPEVLAVSMARKQRIFGMVDKEGNLVPSLLAVLDGMRSPAEEKVISGNIENILRAKLQDSLFFYREDTKARLETKREELKNLVFVKGAGSMLEKSQRLSTLARLVADDLNLDPGQKGSLERAATLCKSDLLTQMVGEFPELQGIMGKYYAIENGEDKQAAQAIGEQYLPRTVQDSMPQTLAGSLLSILDKVDLVTACFGLGLEPSSSADPYGLRRSASAIFKIMLEQKINLPLKTLLTQTQKELGDYILKDKQAALEKRLEAFLKDRFKAVLADRGLGEDLVEAVIATGFERPYETFLRVRALGRISGESAFRQAAKVVERTFNILKGNKEALPAVIDPSIFTEALEHEVFKRYESCRDRILAAQNAQDYALATNLYAGAFFDILGEFFEKVFINTEDMRVRTNRLLLLKTIKELYTKNIAELSGIVFTDK